MKNETMSIYFPTAKERKQFIKELTEKDAKELLEYFIKITHERLKIELLEVMKYNKKIQITNKNIKI